MQQQTLYEKILRSPESLSWFDFFGGFWKKHTKQDRDYAMIAGTSLDTAESESVMLQKWQAPWLWKNVFMSGLLISLFLALIITKFNDAPAFVLLFLSIAPAVVPFSVMFFLWEMNVPRNISLVDVFQYFVLGGITSLVVTFLIHKIPGTMGAPGQYYYAPISEEPAKLIIAYFFLYKLKSKGKVYGLNGLVIGAAVGAGFAAFESTQYAFMNLLGSTEAMLTNAILRAFCAICGHVVFAAPYSCMMALAMGKSSSFINTVFNKGVLLTFIVSFIAHAAWNSKFNVTPIITIPLFTIILWYSCGVGMRKSFRQLVDKIAINTNTRKTTTNLQLRCINGPHAGVSFNITRDEILIGTDSTCNLTFPMTLTEIDRRHCKLIVQNGALYIADLGSRTGTYVNGKRCQLGTGYILNKGDSFTIGSDAQKFEVF